MNIYDNFEIIDSKTAKEFIDDIYGPNYESYNKQDENYFECALIDGRVIIKYPKNKLKNNKYVYQIGKLNNDNTFISEYLIIYLKYDSHFDKIKYKINDYLQSLEQQFVNGAYPITENYLNFEEIGKVIKLNQINNANLSNNNIQQDIQPEQKMEIDYEYDQQNFGYGQQDKNKTEIPKYTFKDYNLDENTPSRTINDNFPMPPLIGLDNIGATCYMNATLQCLCNIPKFVNYFKYNKRLKDIVKNDLMNGNKMLSSSFKLLIEKLWPDRLYISNNPTQFYNVGSNNSFLNKKNESYAPNEFKNKISAMNELFKGVQANDAKDLVNFLIMTLHNELNQADNKNMNINVLNQDQTNKQLMFQLFTNEFINTNKSIISDLFYGVNYNIVQCQGCFTKSFNYQTYFFLVFPLEEVRLFKNQNNFNNYNYNMNFNNNEINIYDCFLYEQRINYMVGENAMYCNYCKNTCNSQMCTFLAFGPEILIIILNRGQGIQYNVKINFVEDLNLFNFIEFKDTGVNYRLIGVITHLGGSDMSGHFIAYCKNPISNSWYQFNDSIVNEVNYNNFKAEVIDYAMPYLLFYQKAGK